jgi:hypothetical protein
MHVWVVWCDANVLSKTAPYEIPTSTAMNIRAAINYDFTINPKKIITESERPDLEGANTSDVPNKDKNHVIKGTTLAGGATLKWDMSRQVRIKILNPHQYPVSALSPVTGTLWSGQPSPNPTTPELYPQNSPAEGNDDTGVNDEINNPYTNNGMLSSSDNPAAGMLHATGDDDETFERRYHFLEFARLNLGQSWFTISDHKPWRVHYKFKRTNGQWKNSSSELQEDNSSW